MESNYYSGWRTSNSFRKRRRYASPDLYDIKYVDGVQVNTYQFEDKDRTCSLCARTELVGLFYCQYQAKTHDFKAEREEYINQHSVCTVCANRIGL